jgi:hypothetical protein
MVRRSLFARGVPATLAVLAVLAVLEGVAAAEPAAWEHAGDLPGPWLAEEAGRVRVRVEREGEDEKSARAAVDRDAQSAADAWITKRLAEELGGDADAVKRIAAAARRRRSPRPR